MLLGVIVTLQDLLPANSAWCRMCVRVRFAGYRMCVRVGGILDRNAFLLSLCATTCTAAACLRLDSRSRTCALFCNRSYCRHASLLELFKTGWGKDGAKGQGEVQDDAED